MDLEDRTACWRLADSASVTVTAWTRRKEKGFLRINGLDTVAWRGHCVKENFDLSCSSALGLKKARSLEGAAKELAPLGQSQGQIT